MQVQVLLQQGQMQPSAVQLDAAAVVEHSQKAAALLERFKNSHKRQQAFELQVRPCFASEQAVHGLLLCQQHLTSSAAAGSYSCSRLFLERTSYCHVLQLRTVSSW